MEMHSDAATFEDWQFFISINYILHYVKAIRYSPKRNKSTVYKRDCTKMSATTLFILAPNEVLPKYSSVKNQFFFFYKMLY